MKIETNTLERTIILRMRGVFTKEQCREISFQILKYKEGGSEPPEFNRNVNSGCWMGRPLQFNGFTPDIAELIEKRFRMACTTYYENLPKPEFILTNSPTNLYDEDWTLFSWANVNNPGAENREHTHTGNIVSGVAYFQSQGTGMLEFMPYNYTYKMSHPAWPYYGVAEYEPGDGDILLFPSFLLHRVKPNPSEHQRINMSFDAKLVPEMQLRHYADK